MSTYPPIEYVDLNMQTKLLHKGDVWNYDFKYDGKVFSWKQIVPLDMFPGDSPDFPMVPRMLKRS